MRLQPNSILAERYRLERFLGEGGMGEVWSATHLATGRQLAIKRLTCRPHESRFGEARARFLLEARSACAVDHPNVVQVFDVVGGEDDVPFIVMELLEGETLAERLWREGALTPLTTARLLLPVVSAVGTAHARGIVHRDLKPANIFLIGDPRGRAVPVVKVLDFGIAKWLGSGHPDAAHTETGSTLGTPSYMSPEQATGERSIDHRSDVWSLGVMLYECLSGVRPIHSDNAAQMMMRLLSSGIIPIDQLVGQLPTGWAALVTSMLRREVRRRPEDLRPVYEALARVSDIACPAFALPLLAQPAAPREPSLEPSEPSSEGSATRGADAAVGWTPPTRRQGVAGPQSDEPSRAKRMRFRSELLVVAVVGAVGLLVTFGWLASVPQNRSGVAPSTALIELPGATERAGAQPVPLAGAPLAPSLPIVEYLTSQEDTAALSRDRREPPPAPLARGEPSRPGVNVRARSTRFRNQANDIPAGAPTGSTARTPCETSAECKSRLCVAYTCR